MTDKKPKIVSDLPMELTHLGPKHGSKMIKEIDNLEVHLDLLLG